MPAACAATFEDRRRKTLADTMQSLLLSSGDVRVEGLNHLVGRLKLLCEPFPKVVAEIIHAFLRYEPQVGDIIYAQFIPSPEFWLPARITRLTRHTATVHYLRFPTSTDASGLKPNLQLVPPCHPILAEDVLGELLLAHHDSNYSDPLTSNEVERMNRTYADILGMGSTPSLSQNCADLTILKLRQGKRPDESLACVFDFIFDLKISQYPILL